MNVLGIIYAASEELHFDEEGIVTHSAILPETAEIIFGGLASIIIFVLLAKFAGPAIKKGMAARTEKIQKQLDDAASDRASAASEASQIRQAKGDINAERARLLADADVQAATLIEDGRVRIQQELAELEAKAAADIVAARGRSTDELRAEISRLSSAAVDHVVTGTLDDATQQVLIENFISTVGASA